MAYERLDIEVTDNGSSRKVERSLVDLGRTGKQSAEQVARSMAAMAIASSNSTANFVQQLQQLQVQFAALNRASASLSWSTLIANALAAMHSVGLLDAAIVGYSAAAIGSSRASLLSSSAMGTVAISAASAASPISALIALMNTGSAAAFRMATAMLLAGSAYKQLLLAGPPRQLLLPAPPPQLLLAGPAGAAGAAGAAAGANNFANILQRIQGLAGSTRTAMGGMWNSIRSGAASAGAAIANAFSGMGGGRGGGGPAAGAAAAAGGLNNITQAARNASSALITMNTLMYSLQLGLLAAAAIKWADEWQNIQNKLDLVTRSTQELADVNQVLYETAQRTRTGYSEIVELFQSLRLQAAGLGLSMKATAELTETVAMASQIGSLGPAQAQAGILQLTQALALGRLSGQNLNSVLQATPRLAIAIAEGLGKAPNELRALAEAGALTADVIVEALQNQAPKIAEEFLRLKPSIGSAFAVLNNGAIEFMGNIERSTGFASGFSESIITLSKNMDIAAAAVVAIGAALLVAFGGAVQRAIIATGVAIAANPLGAFIALTVATVAAVTILKDRMDEFPKTTAAIAGAIAILGAMLIGPMVTSLIAATAATWTFTVALLANPFTWLAIALGATVAAIVFFGNKTYEVNGKVISGWSYLRAAAAGTWAAIVAGAQALWANLSTIFTAIVQGLGSLGMAFLSVMRGDFVDAAAWGKKAFNGVVGEFESIGTAMGDAYTGAFNASVAAAQVVKPKTDAETALDDTGTTPVPYTNGNGKGQGQGKDGEARGARKLTRAETVKAELDRIRQETITAANLTYSFLDRSAYQAIDKFNESLRGKKDGKGTPFALLSETEQQVMLEAILGLESATRVQKIRDQVVEDALGPMLKYKESQLAINQALSVGKISQEEYERAMLKAGEAYYSTQIDEHSGKMLGLARIMLDMQDKAAPLADAITNIWEETAGPLREYEAGLKAVEVLGQQQLLTTRQQTQALRNLRIAYLEAIPGGASVGQGLELGRLRTQQNTEEGAGSRVASAYEDQYNRANQALQSLQANAVALKQLMVDDPINSGQYAQAMQQLGIESLILRGSLPDATAFDGIKAGFASFVQDFKGVVPSLTAAWTDFFGTFSTGIADSIGQAIVFGDNLGASLKRVAQDALASLISALVQMGIQWLVMQLVGQAALTSIAATGATVAAATATAWAPAAAMVSLATMGANAGPAVAAMAITNAMALGMAQLGGLAGFEKGGYTGNMGTKQVAGVVHGREFVVNANATQEWLPFLQAINAGQAITGYQMGGQVGSSGRINPAVISNAGSGGNGLQVVIEDHAGVDIKVERLNRDQVRIIAREVAEDTVAEKAGDAAATSLARPNSKLSKAMSNRTTARPRR